MIRARRDRWLMPRCVRLHLTIMGDHVGYTIWKIEDWKRLLEEMY